MKITLIFPPHWTLDTPYPSLPYLTAYLRDKGHHVTQHDLNIEMFDELLSSNSIECALKVMQEMYTDMVILTELSISQAQHIAQIEESLICGASVARDIDKAKRILRNMDASNAQEYAKSLEWAWGCVNRAVNIINNAYVYPDYMGKDLFLYSEKLETFENYTEKSKALPHELECFLTERIERILNSDSPDLIGISVVTSTQLVFALRICTIIRKLHSDIHITIGGPYLSLFARDLEAVGRVLEFSDTVVLFEGESALNDICLALESKLAWSDCRNTLWKDGDCVDCCKHFTIENQNTAPPPDYDGLPLELYLTPQMVVSLVVNIGCYWNHCTFCSYNNNYFGEFREKEPEVVAQQMKTVSAKYNTNLFTLISSAIRPEWAERLSEEVYSDNYIMNGMFRIEDTLTRSRIRKLRRAGFFQMQFGVESGCKSVLARMKKGISLDVALSLVKICSEENIRTLLYFMSNFPEESIAEFRETAKFIRKISKYADSFCITEFVLAFNSPIWNNPEEYNLEDKVYMFENTLEQPASYLLPGVEIPERRQLITDELALLAEKVSMTHSAFNKHRYFYRKPTFKGSSIYVMMAMLERYGGLLSEGLEDEKVRVEKNTPFRLKTSVSKTRNRLPDRVIKNHSTTNLYDSIRPYVFVNESDYKRWDKLYLYDEETHSMIRMPGVVDEVVSLCKEWNNVAGIVCSIDDSFIGERSDISNMVEEIINSIGSSDMLEQGNE